MSFDQPKPDETNLLTFYHHNGGLLDNSFLRISLITIAVPLLLIVGWTAWENNFWITDSRADDVPAAQADAFHGGTTEAVPVGPDAGSSVAEPAGDPLAQAGTLDEVLQQTHAARPSVQQAVQDASACGHGQGLAADGEALAQASTTRADLAQRVRNTVLTAIPDGAHLADNLVTALQKSAAADEEFHAWVGDLQETCKPATAMSDSHARKATDLSRDATAAKRAFLAQWNQLARQYGLRSWQESDL